MTVKDEAFPPDGYGNQRRQFKLNKKTSRGKTNHSLEVEALLISCNSQYILTTAAAAADK